MIDREKTIRDLETLGAWHTHHYNPFHYECAETIHNVLELLKEQEPSGWISVKEKLPGEGIWVLVWEKQGFAYNDKLVSGVWQIGANNGAIITHWMPLPEGPKEAQ